LSNYMADKVATDDGRIVTNTSIRKLQKCCYALAHSGCVLQGLLGCLVQVVVFFDQSVNILHTWHMAIRDGLPKQKVMSTFDMVFDSGNRRYLLCIWVLVDLQV
jgi:hypothetical protein